MLTQACEGGAFQGCEGAECTTGSRPGYVENRVKKGIAGFTVPLPLDERIKSASLKRGVFVRPGHAALFVAIEAKCNSMVG